MIDTREIGAGSYPEPKEPKEKCYQFDFNATIRGYGVVYAESIEEARARIYNKDYDEIIETYDMEIEEITSIQEE